MTILYVDDDADDRMLLADALQIAAPHYIIETAKDGYQAIDFLDHRREKLPCLVILDLNMPGMDGKELIRKLKKDHELQSVPLVAFTTSADPSDRKLCAELGVDMITKPITFSDLARTVGQLLSYCDARA